MCAREKDIEAKGERGIEGTSDSGAQGVGIARGMRLYHIAPILLSIPPVGRYLLRSLFFLRTVEQKEITRARHPFYSAKVSPGRLLPVSSLSLLHPSFAFSSDSPFSDPHSLRPSLGIPLAPVISAFSARSFSTVGCLTEKKVRVTNERIRADEERERGRKIMKNIY